MPVASGSFQADAAAPTADDAQGVPLDSLDPAMQAAVRAQLAQAGVAENADVEVVMQQPAAAAPAAPAQTFEQLKATLQPGQLAVYHGTDGQDGKVLLASADGAFDGFLLSLDADGQSIDSNIVNHRVFTQALTKHLMGQYKGKQGGRNTNHYVKQIVAALQKEPTAGHSQLLEADPSTRRLIEANAPIVQNRDYTPAQIAALEAQAGQSTAASTVHVMTTASTGPVSNVSTKATAHSITTQQAAGSLQAPTVGRTAVTTATPDAKPLPIRSNKQQDAAAAASPLSLAFAAAHDKAEQSPVVKALRAKAAGMHVAARWFRSLSPRAVALRLQAQTLRDKAAELRSEPSLASLDSAMAAERKLPAGYMPGGNTPAPTSPIVPSALVAAAVALYLGRSRLSRVAGQAGTIMHNKLVPVRDAAGKAKTAVMDKYSSLTAWIDRTKTETFGSPQRNDVDVFEAIKQSAAEQREPTPAQLETNGDIKVIESDSSVSQPAPVVAPVEAIVVPAQVAVEVDARNEAVTNEAADAQAPVVKVALTTPVASSLTFEESVRLHEGSDLLAEPAPAQAKLKTPVIATGVTLGSALAVGALLLAASRAQSARPAAGRRKAPTLVHA